MKKAFLIFSVSLNLLFTLALICVLQFEMAKEGAELEARQAKTDALKSEAVLLLDRAEGRYDKGDVASACRDLGLAQYVLFGYESEEVTTILGEAVVFFSENGTESVEELFFSFVDEMKMIISGELDVSQSRTAFEISSAMADESIEDNSQGIFWEGSAVKESAAREKVEKILGKNLLLRSCESSVFPDRYIFAGGNTYGSVTRMGGGVRQLLFYAGRESPRISEQRAIALMETFLDEYGYKELTLGFSFSLDGVYYARFVSSLDSDRYLTVGVRGTSGNVCFFEAEHFLSGK